MILSCHQVCKSFGDVSILKNASFHIEEREKAAVVGINGAGKSTLLKVIVGELPADSGSVTLAKDKTLGYLAQHQECDSAQTIYDTLLEVKRDVLALEERMRSLERAMKTAEDSELSRLMDAYSSASHEFEQKDGYAWKSEITGILKGLGFSEEEFSKKVSTLSGGQRTRVYLGRLLLSKPDVILLDEPTNHLDIGSIAWLETYLMNYPGSVLIVSHDRYFLDRVVTKVIEIDQGRVTMFSGNYTAYAAKAAMLREARQKEYLNQQAEIRHQEEVIRKLRSFNREKSIRRAESREKMLARMERVEKPTEAASAMRISLEPRLMSGNDVLTVRDLAKSFGSQKLFSEVSFEIKRGERVAVIGDNGTGKTTLLKIINGLLPADEGDVRLGTRVHIGYYDQEQQVLHMEKTLFDELQDAYPDMDNTQVRKVLAAFLFTGDDVFKQVKDLSGGERGRLSLAKLMLSESNFLILDEPTNHLDMVSKEILEDALNSYTGTVLYVSHDRYFINRTATRILELTGNTFVNYIGNYDYYLEKREALTAAFVRQEAAPSPEASAPSDTKADWKAQKEAQARQRKQQAELKKTEEAIAALEARNAEIDEISARPEVCTNMSELLKLTKEKEENEKRLSGLYERWESLAEAESL